MKTSNKPTPEEAAASAQAAKEANEAYQIKLQDTIDKVKVLVDEVENVSAKTEELKIVSLYKVGEQVIACVEGLNARELKVVVGKLHKATGMDESFFYLAKQIAATFSQDQLDAMKQNGITVRVLKALVAIKDQKLREKALARAMSEGLDADSIRTMKGSKGTRKGAADKNKRAKDSKKPPMRVFTQGLDRLTMVGQTLGSCTDAVSRLSECKTEAERKEALQVLVNIRNQVPDLVAELQAFMKFTASASKQATK